MQLNTLGFHHITMVSSDARRTLAFYRDVLGLVLVKRTVNFDDPSSYHLYFGDPTGAPGTIVTFFEWPHAPKGRHGTGGVHHLALGTATYESLLKWKRRLRIDQSQQRPIRNAPISQAAPYSYRDLSFCGQATI